MSQYPKGKENIAMLIVNCVDMTESELRWDSVNYLSKKDNEINTD